jgi:hypothetical protein
MAVRLIVTLLGCVMLGLLSGQVLAQFTLTGTTAFSGPASGYSAYNGGDL